MRLSFLIRNMGVRGSIRRIVELSNRMLLRGHDVSIYHSDGSECEWLTCYAKTLPEGQVVEDEHDAVIFFGDVEHYWMLEKTKAAVKCMYVLGVNDKDPDIEQIITGDGRADSRTMTVRKCLRSPAYTILANCSALVDFFGGLGIKVYPVIGGVNFEMFYPRPVDRDMTTILAGGAKREIEGTTQVIQTMNLLQETNPDLKVEFYAKRGYSQDYLAELYSRSAVFLDCQHHGGWNNPVAEAMACGTPVVCTNIHGNRDFAVNKRTAMLADNPEKAAWAIRRLLSEPDLYEMLRSNALEAIKPFTWDKATDMLEEVLSEKLK